jgi:hypothetical protein
MWFIVSINSYIFRHWGANFRDSVKVKEQKYYTPIQTWIRVFTWFIPVVFDLYKWVKIDE